MLKSYLPLAGMTGVLALCGWLVAGAAGVAMVAGLFVVLALTAPRLSPEAAMRLHGAIPLPPAAVPDLYRGLARLAGRAGLRALPTLYRVPSRLPNAFAVGERDRAAIALSDGLLALLDGRELGGVIAHEVAHVAANDLGVMRLGDLCARLTSFVSTFGVTTALFAMLLVPGAVVPLWAVVVLALAPTGLALMQLALARNREFAADRAAARLTGDPVGLASALEALEAANRWTLRRLFGRLSGLEAPSYLRTHPSARERIVRLLAGAPAPRRPRVAAAQPWRLQF